jgi:hypothetical protein
MKSLRVETEKLLDGATVTGSGRAIALSGPQHTFQAYGITSAGSGSAVVDIEVSSVELPTSNSDWILAGTITLTLGTTATADGFVINAPWKWVRAKVNTLTGTGASVTAWKGTPK